MSWALTGTAVTKPIDRNCPVSGAGVRYRKAVRGNYVNTAPDLASVLNNPALKVMVGSGYYDLVTPFFDAEYTLNRHGIARDDIIYRYYHGGHMMYVHEPSRSLVGRYAAVYSITGGHHAAVIMARGLAIK